MASVSSSLPSWPSESNSTSLRGDVSFSSYLNTTSEESYIRTLVPPQGSRKNKAEDEGEIDVFSADKYFSSRVEIKDGSHNECVVEVVNQPRTLSYQSESSSWNSQSALLRRVQRIPSRGNNNNNNSNNKVKGKRVFFPCCSCSNKNSVNVEDEPIRVHGKRDVSLRSIKTSHDTAEIARMNKLRLERKTFDPLFFTPVSDSLARSLTTRVKKTQQQQQPSMNLASTGFGEVEIYEEKEDERRKSLEVFGSSEMLDDHGIVEKRLNMLSWDAIPRVVATHEINNSEIGSGPPSEYSYKDTDSDASSDLFEIECLSCAANPVAVVEGGSRFPSDGSATPTTCYAPSEASIQWSVVTATAADFSTVFSDSEDQRSGITSVTRRKMMPPKMNRPSGNKMSPLGKMSPSGKMPGMLLGCKSQKAVRVAEEVYRTPVPREKLERESS